MKIKNMILKNNNFSLSSLLFLIIACFQQLTAQENPNWRPITPAEMALKTSLVEKDADAEAIFWEVRIDDSRGSKLAFEHYVRIKIFTERGREKFSKFDIPFYKGRKVENVAARVVKPDGTIIAIRSDEVFEKDIYKGDDVKIRAKSFAVNGIEPGVILEYKYNEIIKNDSLNNERLFFQKDIPLQKISYYIKPADGLSVSTLFFNTPATLIFTPDKDKFQVATMTNVPAFKEEPRMPPEEESRPWVLLYYESFYFSPRWENIVSQISSGFTEFFKAKNEVQKTAASLTANLTTPEEKAKKIYEFVQTEIKNITFMTMPDSQRKSIENKTANDTLKRKMGSAQDIDQLFGSMLYSLGLDVRLVFSGDRSQKFFNPKTDNHFSFLHPCCIAVNYNGKWNYFNPGSPYLPFGKLVWEEELVYSVLIGDNTYKLDSTPLSDHTQSTVKRKGNFKLSEEGTLEGDFSLEYYGQMSVNRRRKAFIEGEKVLEDEFKDLLKIKISTAELTEFKIESLYENSKPLVYRGKIKIPNYSDRTGKRLFLKPGFFEYGEKPEFSNGTRYNDLYFNYPWSEEDEVEISLPKGFSLESPDVPGKIIDPGKIGSLEIKIFDKKDSISYQRKFYFGGGGNISFPAKAYQPLKQLFDAFHTADNHSLTLKLN